MSQSKIKVSGSPSTKRANYKILIWTLKQKNSFKVNTVDIFTQLSDCSHLNIGVSEFHTITVTF